MMTPSITSTVWNGHRAHEERLAGAERVRRGDDPLRQPRPEARARQIELVPFRPGP
jgi:hypothetical protein